MGTASGTPYVLVHGGGFDSRCWELLLPHLDRPALAVDLPGRGRHPADLRRVTFADCARSVYEDIDAAGLDEVVLVGHSLAGCSMPAIAGLLGARVRHAVFVACTVPEHGQSVVDTLEPEVREMAHQVADHDPAPMPPEVARIVIGQDLSDEQFAWCAARTVAEAPPLTFDPVDLSGLPPALPRTWIRTLRDIVVPADKQLRFVANVADCDVVDLDSGHMCMVSRPQELAALLAEIAT